MTIEPTRTGDAREQPLPPVLKEAIAAHQAGRPDEAFPLYRRFLEDHPAHPTALQLFGLLHSQRGEFEDAIRLMRESLRLFPEQAEVANNLGNALKRAGRPEEAVEAYVQAIKLSPRYGDAVRNLGVCLLELERLDEAEKCFRHCLELNTDDAAAWFSLGNVLKRKSAFAAAVPCYERALELRADYAEAHHNLGVCLRLAQRADEAVEHYNAARALGLDRAELYYNLGNAYVDMQDPAAAIDNYRLAIARNPEDIVSHRNLNTLLWVQEAGEDFLKSYQDALVRAPDSVPLRQAYAVALNQQERFDEAEKVLLQGLRRTPDAAALKSLLGFAMEGQQRWQDALQMHAAAVSSADSVPDHRVSYARALLACGRPDEAITHAEQAARETPLNQRALAYLGLCWRLIDQESDAALNDYQNFVRVYDVPVPAPYANAAEFNERLVEVLQSLHVGKRHPPDQTLRGGTQTHGDLFNRAAPEIQELVAGIRACINDYIAALPQDMAHPLLARRSDSFEFAASWSVRLRRCGYHTMHVHPMGWISSAYYVQVPPEVSGGSESGGDIRFGQPDIDLGEDGRPRRIIQPAVGRLVLFPSYMWHGTTPFEADAPRTTVAFDVVPGAR